MAWNNLNRTNKFTYTMVDYKGNPVGVLDGVIDAQLEYDYESNIRKIATIRTVNDNYKDWNGIKIEVETSDGDKADLGTYFVKQVNRTIKGGNLYKDYSLASILWKMSNWIIGWQGDIVYSGERTFDSCKWLIRDELNQDDKKEWAINIDSVLAQKRYNFGADYTIRVNTKKIDCLTELCKLYNADYSVTNSVQVNIYNRISPHTKSPKFTFSLDNCTINNNEITMTDNRYNTPNYVWSYAKDFTTQPQWPYWAGTNAPHESGIHSDKTHTCIQEYYDIGTFDIQPISAFESLMKEKSRQYIKEKSLVVNEYSFGGIYCGLDIADCCEIELENSVKKCYVSKESIKLTPAMQTSYVIKEVNNYD